MSERHRILADAEGRAIGGCTIESRDGLALAWAINERGEPWPWIVTYCQPFSGKVENWPSHEYETILPPHTRRRIERAGHTCGVQATTTGAPCRRYVRDGGPCAQHQASAPTRPPGHAGPVGPSD